MKVHRGDVVIIDHPFSDATGAKVRPALVVQNGQRNALLTETIIAQISTNIRHVATDPTQLLIDLSTPDGKASGLKQTSAVKCAKLFEDSPWDSVAAAMERRRIEEEGETGTLQR